MDGQLLDVAFQKLEENGLSLQHLCLFDIHRRVCALQLALFALFSKIRGLNS